MTERPILFNSAMVRAILAGHKTQTRRLVAPQSAGAWRIVSAFPFEAPARWVETNAGDPPARIPVRCPCGEPGDVLWVREAWQDWCPIWNGLWCGCGSAEMIARTHRVAFRAGPEDAVDGVRPLKWRPSIFMPRWACRLRLRVEAVGLERLQAITEADAVAEGCRSAAETPGAPGEIIDDARSASDMYAELWDTINRKRAPWASNPWVWVVTFSMAPRIPLDSTECRDSVPPVAPGTSGPCVKGDRDGA